MSNDTFDGPDGHTIELTGPGAFTNCHQCGQPCAVSGVVQDHSTFLVEAHTCGDVAMSPVTVPLGVIEFDVHARNAEAAVKAHIEAKLREMGFDGFWVAVSDTLPTLKAQPRFEAPGWTANLPPKKW